MKFQYKAPELKNLVTSNILLPILLLILYNGAYGQIVNGNFNQPGVITGSSCHAGTGWTTATGNMSSQYTNLLGSGANFWIDITPCWSSGNGTYIEQVVPTTIGQCYYLKFDLGAYCKWDMSDAGVYITIDGNPLGQRVFNDSFDCNTQYKMYWATRTSQSFIATGTTTKIRFTGEGRCTKQSLTTGYNCTPIGSITDPGVMGIDNIDLIAGTAPVHASINTGYDCGTGNGVTIHATGASQFATIQWSVLSGPAVITGAGHSINVTATGLSKILMSVTDVSACSVQKLDTITIMALTAIVNAGQTKLLTGCGGIADTLLATLTNTTPGVNYDIDWTPSQYITYPMNNKLRPVVKPTTTTIFTLYVSAESCIWTDKVTVEVNNKQEDIADFTYTLKAGCSEDTIILTNKTNTNFGPLTYRWMFGDNSNINTSKDPIHIYTKKGQYNIILIANNGFCNDTISHNIDITPYIKADIQIIDDRICQQDSVQFYSSFSGNVNPVFVKTTWHFGDNTTSTHSNEKHSYTLPGTYTVLLVVTDTISNCADTARGIVNNKALLLSPYIDIGPMDTTVCSDVTLYLPLGISVRGTSYLWSDGSTNPRHYASRPGTYIVTLINDCGVGYDTITIKHKNCSIWFPSAFTPNGDEKNDLARVIGEGLDDITDFELSIYNRWGNNIFLTNDIYKGWDGTYKSIPQPLGTYYYYIRYNLQKEKYFQKGDITLLR